jgi:hypothetical protein
MSKITLNKVLRQFWLFLALISFFSVQSLYAAPQCGNFEKVSIPGSLSLLTSSENGTATALGDGVLRYFDGTSWSEQGLPSESEGFHFGASGSTPDGEAWFAGTRVIDVYTLEVIMMRVTAGVVDRIDTLSYPSSINTPGAPVDISASASNNVWAVISRGDVLHFDGFSWEVIDVPDVFVDQILERTKIYTTSPNDVWIAGTGSSGKNADRGYVQHWNGFVWITIPTPFDGQSHKLFYDIDGSGPDDIWIVGQYINEDILLHWNGSIWQEASGPGQAMFHVMSMAPNNAWAIVQNKGPHYWDGSQWSEAVITGFEEATTLLISDVAKGNSCDAWMIGTYYEGSTNQPWAARLIPGDVVPPPPPSEFKVYADSIDVSRVKVRRKTYYGQSIVTVLDSNGLPVVGATITGDFSGPTSTRKSSTTGVDGKAVLKSSKKYRPRGEWCFEVAVITAAGATYDSNLNTVTSACEERRRKR